MFQAKLDGGWVGSDEQSAEWNWIPEMICYHIHWGGGREECRCTGGVLMSGQRWGSLDERKANWGRWRVVYFLCTRHRRNGNENG